MRTGEFLPGRRCRTQGGFTLVALLAALALLALATHQVMAVVSQQAQREREADLLRSGADIVRAIGAYHERSPGAVKQWPWSLEELTNDRRFVSLLRHLRRVPLDPFTRTDDWGIVAAPGGGIAGVYSKGQARPIRAAGAEPAELGLGSAQHYSEWRFIYKPAPDSPPMEHKP
ncbi:type II secretion system protein [Comamonas endophytica]|uniref:Type II secretion system protein n=2 Tax=Comamonas endophytica TaxID=2949090 RepID=A0ABY6GCM0_9BURK|nr:MULTISPECIES: type II secretion system protein [unclassified Acidovorax]MCD2513778.1 type II secretion system protein [Acidovorax sp. D4N7]UYG52219.1 type II secretion system protein [Acidovorax sp. 5MLIR]